MSAKLIILFTSMIPIAELRLAIPLAITVYKMPVLTAFLWAVIGNMIPVIFLLWFLKAISEFLKKHFYFFNQLFTWLFTRTRKKHSQKFEHWQEFALIVLVGIPLPFTGAWTGALAAFVFGVPLKRAFWLIALGVLIAGTFVSLATMGVINLFN